MSVNINADTTNGLVLTSDTSGEIKLQSAGTDTVTVKSDGKVGIGTSSPSVSLHLKGNSFANAIRWEETGGNNNFYSGPIDSSGNFGIDNNSSSGYIRFSTNSAERMRIDSSGALLVGKTGLDTTNAGLWINSNIANGYGRINFIKGTSSGTGSTASCAFYYNGTSVGNIVNTSTATAFNTSSDYRLKDNVLPMSGSIDRLKQLKPSTWSWKLDGSHGEGFIAHEAQTVVPESVTGTKDAVDDEGNPVYQGIDQSKLVPLLTAALQEAITKIEDLETRIQSLENA